ncbi:hypothetical protein F5877DRAFT_86383 [Lentinula edodes]|nr:hypothetical protein F5877DRAFT_86383 [Lentinula edodes]
MPKVAAPNMNPTKVNRQMDKNSVIEWTNAMDAIALQSTSQQQKHPEQALIFALGAFIAGECSLASILALAYTGFADVLANASGSGNGHSHFGRTGRNS